MMNTDKIYAEAVANEYAPKNGSRLLALRKLDRRAKLPAQIFTYTFGVLASLVAGVGMCLSMHVIGSGGAVQMVLGVALGVVGFGAMSVNYPIYRKIAEAGKQRYASDIIRLAREISDEA